jgi:hypothetical protein
MDERQPMTLGAPKPVEQPLPPEEREREGRGRVAGVVGPTLRDSQIAAKDALR